MKPYVRYALLGLAVGGRCTAGPAALAWSGSNAVAKKISAAGAAVELVGDKLPMTPSRLEPPGLIARAVSSAGSAIVLARRVDDDQRVAAVVSMVAAGLGATLGARFRMLVAPAPPTVATPEDMAVTTRGEKAGGATNVLAGAAEDVVVAALAWRAVSF